MELSRGAAAAAIATATAAFALLLRATGSLVGVDLALYESYLAGLGDRGVPPAPVSLLVITDADLRFAGQVPVPDELLARGLETLLALEPRVVGIDLFRDLPVPPGSERLDAVLRDDARVYGVYTVPSAARRVAPPRALVGTERAGFAGVLPDPDGKVRRALLFQDDADGAAHFALGWRLAQAYLAVEGVHPSLDPERPDWVRLGETTIPRLGADAGGYVDADVGGYQFLIDFRRARTGFDRFELRELLDGRVADTRVRDRIVIVGTTAEGAHDIFDVPTPHGDRDAFGMPGPELHGHIAEQLVRFGRGQHRPLAVLPGAAEVAAVAALAALGVLAALGPAKWAAAIVAAGLAGLWAVGFTALRFDVWVPTAAPSLAWVSGALVTSAWSSSRERRERTLLKDLFSRHVSATIADQVWAQRHEFLEGGRPKAQRLVATVLFLDIRDSTRTAEKLDAEDRMRWTNAFMNAMGNTIGEYGGLVDDYFGDGIKADFGVPVARESEEEIAADATRAVYCAFALRGELGALNRGFEREGLPPVAMRVGIHTGAVVAGLLGSRDRLKYTTVGEPCVIAQRVESLDTVPHDFEADPCRILITEDTRVRVAHHFETESLGPVSLKGKTEPLEVHRVFHAGAPDLAQGGAPS